MFLKRREHPGLGQTANTRLKLTAAQGCAQDDSESRILARRGMKRREDTDGGGFDGRSDQWFKRRVV